MSFIAGIITGAVGALIVSWYVRHPDEHEHGEVPVESRTNKPENEEHERVERERQRQFDKLMTYTGSNQKL